MDVAAPAASLFSRDNALPHIGASVMASSTLALRRYAGNRRFQGAICRQCCVFSAFCRQLNSSTKL